MSNPADLVTIKIPARPTLADVESRLLALPSKIQSVEIWLPSDTGANFFAETRLAGLIASAGSKHRLTVVDSGITHRSPESFTSRFGEEIEGISCLVNAQSIQSAQRSPPPFSQSNALKRIERRDGLLESEKRTTFTVCAIDDVMVRQPLAFAPLSTKEQFKVYLLDRLASAFSSADKDARDTKRSQSESNLAEIVYELFENAHQHGCYDAGNGVVRGVRFLRVKRHITFSRHEFMRRALGFPELAEYISKCLPERHKEGLKLFEIAIGDQGMGIPSRFLATRPDYLSTPIAQDRPAFVNEIIDRALSSKLSQKGAGRGLRNALDAVRSLNGFISLRTEDMWLYDAANIPRVASASPRFRTLDGQSKLGRIAGTYFNVLIQV